MIGRRESRPTAGNTAVGASSGYVERGDVHEQFARMEDEEAWNRSHLTQIIAYNKSSAAFYLLCSASLCFSALNGYHGYTSSGAGRDLFVAIVIGLLYSTIELTVPVSAHLMSWGSESLSRFVVRMVGFCAYALGVAFSLMILQAKFSTGADTASARQEAKSLVFSADRGQLKSAQAIVDSLKGRVGSRSADSVMVEMRAILAQPVNKKETLADSTEECQGPRKSAQERKLCADYDTLSRLREDAKTYAKAMADIEKYSVNLTDESRTSTKNADVQDQVIARVLGLKLEDVQMFKASLIAVLAALLTHILWAAHGITANSAIASARKRHLQRRTLERTVSRMSEADAAAAQEAELRRKEAEAATAAAYLSAKGVSAQIAQVVANAPVNEQPAVMQLQQFFTDSTVMGQEFAQQIGPIHDHYVQWARRQRLTPIGIDRFVPLCKEIGLHVTTDGRLVGAAIRHG